MLEQDKKDNNLIHDDEEINRLKDKVLKNNNLSDLFLDEFILGCKTDQRMG